MRDILRRDISQSVWVPLMAHDKASDGVAYRPGYVKTYQGICAVAFPVEMKAAAMEVQWIDAGIHEGHRPCVENDCFISADIFRDLRNEKEGVRLVLEQSTNIVDGRRILVHHDLILGLGLIQEDDEWLAPDEGYIPVIRVRRDGSGRPMSVEIRAEHLKDFLCARQMGLALYSFCSRDDIVSDEPALGWPTVPYEKRGEHYHWVGNVCGIAETGMLYDGEAFFMHVFRTDADTENDVPELSFPSENGTASRSCSAHATGPRYFRVSGELWRNEWLEPAAYSPRVAGHAWPEKMRFITGPGGEREGEETLSDGGKWLWFRPEVICSLLGNRNAALSWCTRDTGVIAGGPHGRILFGVNDLGLVNVYAKDLYLLPYWQQREWRAHNVAPDGRVSRELLDTQAIGDPADTQAPEAFLSKALERLRRVSRSAIGIELFHNHPSTAVILTRIHRFRATSSAGLLELAKDVTRVVADAMDKKLMNHVLGDPAKPLGSLKALEAILQQRYPKGQVQTICGPLFGIIELRQADAHLPSSSLEVSLAKVRVDQSLPPVVQGRDLLTACVSTLWALGDMLGAGGGVDDKERAPKC